MSGTDNRVIRLTLPQLPTRTVDAHKGDFGHVLIVGGSPGMAGAPALSGLAALRSGAGLVTVACPSGIQSIVASFEPSYMTMAMPAGHDDPWTADAVDRLLPFASRVSCVALGPGLGRTTGAIAVACRLFRKVPVPIVVDADGLYALATSGEPLADRRWGAILTPHPGEFQRFFPGENQDQESLRKAAAGWALTQQVVLVLKGHATIVTDGRRTEYNSTGNPGMASGGSGDVLTGIVAAFVARGLPLWDAARLAVHVHGLAGDLAAAELGQESMIASDLVRYLPAAVRSVTRAAIGSGSESPLRDSAPDHDSMLPPGGRD